MASISVFVKNTVIRFHTHTKAMHRSSLLGSQCRGTAPSRPCSVSGLAPRRPAEAAGQGAGAAAARASSTLSSGTLSSSMGPLGASTCRRGGVGAEQGAARGSVACAAAAGTLNYYPSADNAVSVFFARLRALAFYLVTFIVALPLFFVMLGIFPFVWAFDRYQRRAEHVVNNVWAILSTLPFYRVEIRGKEKLPPKGQAVVFVANHQSFMDIYSLFYLGRPFKFISKTSNFLIPIVGWSMFLTGHVPLQRMDLRSQMQCLSRCSDLLKEGCSVLFFPEGTRSIDGRMADFKKGAFSVAAKLKVPVVPITLDGTGSLMPNQREGEFYPGKVIITIHDPMLSKDAEELCKKSREVIAGSLAPELRGDA